MSLGATNHRSTPLVHAAVIFVTSAWLAIVRLVDRRKGVFARAHAQERDEALAEERRAYLFGTGYPNAASEK